jgi:hypothetical protein
LNLMQRATIDFKFNVTTLLGPLQIPQVTPSITIGGRQSKMIVVNYAFGTSRIIYSTAQVFFAGMLSCLF